MVEEMATRLMKVPLAPAGFAFCTASAKALMFCHQLVGRERCLADAGLDDAGLLDAELDRAALGALDRIGDVHGDGADARVRHHAAGAEHLAEPSDQSHQVGRGDAAVEVDIAALHLLDQILRSDHVGAGGLGLVGLGAAREHRHPHVAAGAVRQVDDAAHHLIGVARIDAEIHRHLDGLVELGLGPLLDHLHRLFERIELHAVDAFAGRNGALSETAHGGYSWTSMPIERAEPSTMRMAASIVSQLRSFIFCSAISLTCALVTLPALSRPGVFEPLSSLAAFLMK